MVDENNFIVATISENLVVLFFTCDESVIWNHKNRVALAIAKDFVYGYEQDVKKADVMYVKGLCGSANDVILKNDFLLETDFNIEMPTIVRNEAQNNGSEELGTVGYVENYENNYRFISEDFIIQFRGEKYTTNRDEMNLLILKDKGKAKINYEDLYEMLKQKNEWYYKTRYQNVSSPAKRAFVESHHYKSYENTYHPKVSRVQK